MGNRNFTAILPYSPAFTCMHLYTKPPVFQSGQVVSFISACTKYLGTSASGCPLVDRQKIWEIWEFSGPNYGGNMGIFTIFPDFSCKNMENMGISNWPSAFPKASL